MGGRVATRRVDALSGAVAFDHGAQYFTVRDADFADRVDHWQAAGIVARWTAAGDDAWVGTPGMNAVPKAMAAPLAVHRNSRIDGIVRHGNGWMLDPGGEVFDGVIVATPAEQAAPLLLPHDPAMAAAARHCPSAPCWTAMVAFDARIAIDTDVVKAIGIIGWAARNSAKPGRTGPEAWVVQATADWSRHHLEEADDSVADTLVDALSGQAAHPLPRPVVRSAHRWRFARVQAGSQGCLWNETLRIGAVGDWLMAPRVEGAWLSGRRLADRILGISRPPSGR